jgi:uncharacterized protein YdaU (DUF1376 family)
MTTQPNTWMPFYVGDYLRDTARLSTEAHGAYLLLIFEYWTSGRPLPDDDRQLAAIAKLSKFRWQKLKILLATFFSVADGVWRHKRIDVELENAKARAAAGRIGAEARWAKTNGTSHAIASEPHPLPLPLPPDPLLLPLPSQPQPQRDPPFAPIKNGGVSPPRCAKGGRRRSSPVTKLFEGAMRAADAISDREEAAEARNRCC